MTQITHTETLRASNGSLLIPVYGGPVEGFIFKGWQIEGTIPPVEEIKTLIADYHERQKQTMSDLGK